MPLGFWNDPDGSKYRAAYFEKYPGVWHHGDYVELTEHDGIVIYGRSDAVLNPGGVRIGTAEIYRQVEQLDEIVESLVVGQQWEHDERIVLFVRLRDDVTLTPELESRIRTHVRANTTPRHVPARIVQVTEIPRTRSGKIVELAVRDMIHGREIRNREALANPEALEQFRDRVELSR
jgi:acetoacetyl-CoA synthetase